MSDVELLVLGLDAMDRDVAHELMAVGRLPALAGLAERGLVAEMGNPIGMYTGPVWPTLLTADGPDRHRRTNWRVLVPGTYRLRYLTGYSALPEPTFLRRLADSGRRVLSIDVPNAGLEEHANLLQVIEWMTHDRRGEVASSPPELAAELQALVPLVAVDLCDEQGAAGELPELRDRLLHEVDGFATSVAEVVRRHQPDVVMAVLSATHCAGHQLWHLHDPASHRHDPIAAAALGDPLLTVYQRVDTAVASLLELTGPSTTVAVVLSHGMHDNVVLPHLADPILRAIDDSFGPPSPWHRGRELVRRTPNRTARLARRALRRPYSAMDHVADGGRRWFPLETFPTHAGVRLNIVGREPNGRIRPDEVDTVVDRLEAELRLVVRTDTGGPVVERVIRTKDHYHRIDESGMPDLLVEWVRDTPITSVTSPTIGTISRPWPETRTGAHLQDGLLLLAGPGVAPEIGPQTLRSIDVWPTLAGLLGVDPGDVDGEGLAVLAVPAVSAG